MPNCTSCGNEIPEGQGRSCSMCYGDIGHGRDGYYQEWADREIARAQEKEMEERQYAEYIEQCMQEEIRKEETRKQFLKEYEKEEAGI